MNYKTISLLLENDKKSRDRMQAFLDKNKAGNFYLSSMKTNVYISRNNLNKLKDINSKKGGFLPLIPILAGIAAGGSVAGAAGIASAVNKKKAEDALIAETKRHNIQLEDAARGKGLNGGSTAPEVEEEEDESSGGSLFLRNGSSVNDHGSSLKEDVVNFVQENDLDNDVKRMVKKTLKGLASVIPMRKEGGSLILAPYKKGGSLVLRDWSEK